MVYTKTHGRDMDSWYRLGLMILTFTHGMLSVLSHHTHRIELSGACMQNIFLTNSGGGVEQ